MKTTPKRLRILGDDEIDNLYGHPRFTQEEQMEYFTLSREEKAVLEQLHSIKSRLHFVLQLGYFKARHLFFVFDLQEVMEDALYIRDQHFPDFQFSDIDVTKVTRLRQQRLILDLYNYRHCHAKERRQLEVRAQQAATVDSKPIYVFRDLTHYLTTQRIISPAYSVMQDIVGKALSFEQNRLSTILRRYLGPSEIDTLNTLLADSKGLYEITLLKREPKDFSANEIKREIQRGDQIRDLYQFADKLLPNLDISNESIKYYASLVTYYSVFRLKQLEEWTVYLYLLCFIYHRYQKLHDNLLKTLIHHVRGYTEEAKGEAKERVYDYRMEGNENLNKVGPLLKLLTDDTIARLTPYHEIQSRAFRILEREKIDFVAEHITTDVKFDETAFQWEHLDDVALQFKRHLRPINASVDWAASAGHYAVIEASDFLKNAFNKGRSPSQYAPRSFPQRFIPDTAKRYLYQSSNFG